MDELTTPVGFYGQECSFVSVKRALSNLEEQRAELECGEVMMRLFKDLQLHSGTLTELTYFKSSWPLRKTIMVAFACYHRL